MKIEIPPCAMKVIFITEFAILCKIFSFYELGENNFAHGGISKYFFLDVQDYN